MRKRTVKCIADTCFWYVLYFLPVIAYGLFLFIHPSNAEGGAISPINFEQFLTDVGFTIATDNVIYTVIQDLFYTGGVLPFFNTTAPVIILSWYVGMVLLHLCIDFVLFIPKLAQRWLCSLYGGEK